MEAASLYTSRTLHPLSGFSYRQHSLHEAKVRWALRLQEALTKNRQGWSGESKEDPPPTELTELTSSHLPTSRLLYHQMLQSHTGTSTSVCRGTSASRCVRHESEARSDDDEERSAQSVALLELNHEGMEDVSTALQDLSNTIQLLYSTYNTLQGPEKSENQLMSQEDEAMPNCQAACNLPIYGEQKYCSSKQAGTFNGSTPAYVSSSFTTSNQKYSFSLSETPSHNTEVMQNYNIVTASDETSILGISYDCGSSDNETNYYNEIAAGTSSTSAMHVEQSFPVRTAKELELSSREAKTSSEVQIQDETEIPPSQQLQPAGFSEHTAELIATEISNFSQSEEASKVPDIHPAISKSATAADVADRYFVLNKNIHHFSELQLIASSTESSTNDNDLYTMQELPSPGLETRLESKTITAAKSDYALTQDPHGCLQVHLASSHSIPPQGSPTFDESNISLKKAEEAVILEVGSLLTMLSSSLATYNESLVAPTMAEKLAEPLSSVHVETNVIAAADTEDKFERENLQHARSFEPTTGNSTVKEPLSCARIDENKKPRPNKLLTSEYTAQDALASDELSVIIADRPQKPQNETVSASCESELAALSLAGSSGQMEQRDISPAMTPIATLELKDHADSGRSRVGIETVPRVTDAKASRLISKVEVNTDNHCENVEQEPPKSAAVEVLAEQRAQPIIETDDFQMQNEFAFALTALHQVQPLYPDCGTESTLTHTSNCIPVAKPISTSLAAPDRIARDAVYQFLSSQFCHLFENSLQLNNQALSEVLLDEDAALTLACCHYLNEHGQQFSSLTYLGRAIKLLAMSSRQDIAALQEYLASEATQVSFFGSNDTPPFPEQFAYRLYVSTQACMETIEYCKLLQTEIQEKRALPVSSWEALRQRVRQKHVNLKKRRAYDANSLLSSQHLQLLLPTVTFPLRRRECIALAEAGRKSFDDHPTQTTQIIEKMRMANRKFDSVEILCTAIAPHLAETFFHTSLPPQTTLSQNKTNRVETSRNAKPRLTGLMKQSSVSSIQHCTEQVNLSFPTETALTVEEKEQKHLRDQLFQSLASSNLFPLEVKLSNSKLNKILETGEGLFTTLSLLKKLGQKNLQFNDVPELCSAIRRELTRTSSEETTKGKQNKSTLQQTTTASSLFQSASWTPLDRDAMFNFLASSKECQIFSHDVRLNDHSLNDILDAGRGVEQAIDLIRTMQQNLRFNNVHEVVNGMKQTAVAIKYSDADRDTLFEWLSSESCNIFLEDVRLSNASLNKLLYAAGDSHTAVAFCEYYQGKYWQCSSPDELAEALVAARQQMDAAIPQMLPYLQSEHTPSLSTHSLKKTYLDIKAGSDTLAHLDRVASKHKALGNKISGLIDAARRSRLEDEDIIRQDINELSQYLGPRWGQLFHEPVPSFLLRHCSNLVYASRKILEKSKAYMHLSKFLETSTKFRTVDELTHAVCAQ